MVRGRLPRESNPVPGQSQPGFVPAFDETGNEDYVRVSNQKPYPVANYTQNPSGVWLPTSENNPMPTQLTGSIMELVTVSGLEVPASSNVRIFNRSNQESLKGIKELEVTYSNVSEFDMTIRFEGFVEHSDSTGVVWSENYFEGAERRGAIRIPAYGDTYRITVYNNSQEDREFHVIGVRGYF